MGQISTTRSIMKYIKREKKITAFPLFLNKKNNLKDFYKKNPKNKISKLVKRSKKILSTTNKGKKDKRKAITKILKKYQLSQ